MLPKSVWSLKNTIKQHKKKKIKISKHFFLEKNVAIQYLRLRLNAKEVLQEKL